MLHKSNLKVYIYTQTHKYTHICCIHLHIDTHTQTHTYNIYPHLHTYIEAHIYTHIYIINTCRTICNLFLESPHPDLASRGNQSVELQ